MSEIKDEKNKLLEIFNLFILFHLDFIHKPNDLKSVNQLKMVMINICF